MLSQVSFQPREYYSEYEKKLWAAIQRDPRIKVLNLNVKRLTRIDRDAMWIKMIPSSDPFLVFKFLCPCGDTRTEIFRMPLDWKKNIGYWENELAETMFQHLKEEGLI